MATEPSRTDTVGKKKYRVAKRDGAWYVFTWYGDRVNIPFKSLAEAHECAWKARKAYREKHGEQ